MDIHEEIRFFDQFESTHGHYDVLSEAAYRRLVGIFMERIRPRPGERCVDLGCGTGAFTRRLRNLGLQLSGVDVSPQSIERARGAAQSGETYSVGDIRATAFETGVFDIVVYSGVLHHVYGEIAAVLAEGHRILRRGGRLFAFDPSAHSPSMFLYRDPRSPFFSREGKTPNEILVDRAQLAHDLRAARFVRAQVQGVSGITYRYVQGSVARRMLPLYNLYEHALRHSPFERWLGTFLVTTAVRP